MPPSLALFLWLVFVVGLFRYDPAKQAGTTSALWIPLIWIFIVATRLPSQWFGARIGQSATILEEGNSFDRTISIILILISIGILFSRSFQWFDFFSKNIALTTFLLFCLLSVVWSDFPFVAFKRWIRDLGGYFVILVALSESDPLEAVRALLRRLYYLLIPLCILLIKYYPALSRHYDPWTGLPTFSGAATSKNTLGVLCLCSGLFFFWDTLARWSKRKEPRMRPIIFVNILFIVMTLWVIEMSSSATSRLCLAIGCLIMLAAHNRAAKIPTYLKVLIPGVISMYGILAFGFGVDINAVVAELMGRDPTLTGREDIWKVVLSVRASSLLGTGYESFWLGPRLLKVWEFFPGINEAHNGYLQMYLQLGFVGLSILGWMLISFFRSISKRGDPSSLASLCLALWSVLAIYNVTEAAFQGGLLWLTLLLGVLMFNQDALRQSQSPFGKTANDGIGRNTTSGRLRYAGGANKRTKRNGKRGSWGNDGAVETTGVPKQN
jgi:exopolysaccharide production protein ExoQ